MWCRSPHNSSYELYDYLYERLHKSHILIRQNDHTNSNLVISIVWNIIRKITLNAILICPYEIGDVCKGYRVSKKHYIFYLEYLNDGLVKLIMHKPNFVFLQQLQTSKCLCLLFASVCAWVCCMGVYVFVCVCVLLYVCVIEHILCGSTCVCD